MIYHTSSAVRLCSRTFFSCAQIWSGAWPNSNARRLIVPKKQKKEKKKKHEEKRRHKKKSIWRSHLENINPHKHTSEASICKSGCLPKSGITLAKNKSNQLF